MQALRNLLLTVPYKKNYQIRKKKKKRYTVPQSHYGKSKNIKRKISSETQKK